MRRRSEVSRTLDEADATPTERHPRENPSPRSPRLLRLLPSPPLPLLLSSFFLALFARSSTKCIGFLGRTVHYMRRYQILGISTGIFRRVDVFVSRIIVRSLAGANSAELKRDLHRAAFDASRWRFLSLASRFARANFWLTKSLAFRHLHNDK